MADEEDATSSVQDADTFIETESPEVIIARIESKSRQVERLLRLLVFLPPSLPRFSFLSLFPIRSLYCLWMDRKTARRFCREKQGGKEQRTLNFSDWCLRCCCCYYE
jgi:hypothetical protein